MYDHSHSSVLLLSSRYHFHQVKVALGINRLSTNVEVIVLSLTFRLVCNDNFNSHEHILWSLTAQLKESLSLRKCFHSGLCEILLIGIIILLTPKDGLKNAVSSRHISLVHICKPSIFTSVFNLLQVFWSRVEAWYFKITHTIRHAITFKVSCFENINQSVFIVVGYKPQHTYNTHNKYLTLGK